MIAANRLLHICIAAIFPMLFGGCNGLNQLRGDGYKESDNWGSELRAKKNEDAAYGGISEKAQQIERNLGVE